MSAQGTLNRTDVLPLAVDRQLRSSMSIRGQLKKLGEKSKSHGIRNVLAERLCRKLGLAVRSFRECEPLFSEKMGLEIGGPSKIFSRGGRFPVYPIAGRLDNGNFSPRTIWEGSIQEGRTYRYDKDRQPGYQYICEAVDLKSVASESYDFVLSSHTLEHVANPLRALREWFRVLKEGGVLVLVVPHKDGTFDHRRPVTPLAHLIQDHEQGTTEDDLTHLPEILELHDLAKDPQAGTSEAFKERSMNNPTNRCLHHHVFNTELVVRVLDHLGLWVCAVDPILPNDIISVSRKLPDGQLPNNGAFLDNCAGFRARSPFASDRV